MRVDLMLRLHSHHLIRRSIEKPVYKEKLRLRSYGVPTLDSKGMKEGDRNLGVYELKSMLSLAESKKLISTHITVDSTFGPGTTKVVNGLLKKWGYKQNGIAGEGFVKKLTAMLK